MKQKIDSQDPEIRGALAALRRSAARARKLAEATGTPLWVMRDGKIININTKMKRKTQRGSKTRAAR
jgi:hypothetical protein